MAGQKSSRKPLQPTTEASRRAFCLKNYLALRTRVDGLPDPSASARTDPSIGATPGRWTDRWEYLATRDDGGAGRALIAAVLTAEDELSARCVRFIHAAAAVADTPKARRFLFAAFAACEAAWGALAGGSGGTTVAGADPVSGGSTP